MFFLSHPAMREMRGKRRRVHEIGPSQRFGRLMKKIGLDDGCPSHRMLERTRTPPVMKMAKAVRVLAKHTGTTPSHL